MWCGLKEPMPHYRMRGEDSYGLQVPCFKTQCAVEGNILSITSIMIFNIAPLWGALFFMLLCYR